MRAFAADVNVGELEQKKKDTFDDVLHTYVGLAREGRFFFLISSPSPTAYVPCTCDGIFGVLCNNSIGHNYIGHNYIGHNYTGHNYIGAGAPLPTAAIGPYIGPYLYMPYLHRP